MQRSKKGSSAGLEVGSYVGVFIGGGLIYYCGWEKDGMAIMVPLFLAVIGALIGGLIGFVVDQFRAKH